MSRQKIDPHLSNNPPANRWARYFARNFDIAWELVLLCFIMFFVIGFYSITSLDWLDTPNKLIDILLAIVMMPFVLIFDAWLYHIAGNTPGKALLGVKVITIHGKALSFTQYLKRNFRMLFSGLGLTIPLISLFTMLSQFWRLQAGQEASYDEPDFKVVNTLRSNFISKLIFTCAFVGVFVGKVALNIMDITQQE